MRSINRIDKIEATNRFRGGLDVFVYDTDGLKYQYDGREQKYLQVISKEEGNIEEDLDDYEEYYKNA